MEENNSQAEENVDSNVEGSEDQDQEDFTQVELLAEMLRLENSSIDCKSEGCDNYGNECHGGLCNACARGETPETANRLKEKNREEARRIQEENQRLQWERDAKEWVSPITLQRRSSKPNLLVVEPEVQRDNSHNEKKNEHKKAIQGIKEDEEIYTTLLTGGVSSEKIFSPTVDCAFKKLSAADYESEIKERSFTQAIVDAEEACSSKLYGDTCPLCNSDFILVELVRSNDGSFDIYQDSVICKNSACAIRRKYEIVEVLK
jgi:hypothetical protein